MEAAEEESIVIFDGDAKRCIGLVREGLRSILTLLEARPSPFSLAGSGGVATSTPVRERSGAQRGMAAHGKKQVAVKPAPTRRAVAKGKRAST